MSPKLIGIEPDKGKGIAEAIVGDLTTALINGTASKNNLNPMDLMKFVRTCSPKVQTMLTIRSLHGEPTVFHELASRHRFNNKILTGFKGRNSPSFPFPFYRSSHRGWTVYPLLYGSR